MKIYEINQQLELLYRNIIIANELGDNLNLVYVFSDADGIRTGKSGWSFGITQLDIQNNPYALLCLREAGFTTDEMVNLRSQSTQFDSCMPAMDTKLSASKTIVDKYDNIQIDDCLTTTLQHCQELNVEFTRLETFLHIADYHNQFGFSRGGKLYTWLKSNKPISPEDIRDFKLTLPWGIKRHDDVIRRYNNIAKAVKP